MSAKSTPLSNKRKKSAGKMNKNKTFEIEEIVSHEERPCGRVYKIRWKNWEKNDLWEKMESELEAAPDLLKKYKRDNYLDEYSKNKENDVAEPAKKKPRVNDREHSVGGSDASIGDAPDPETIQSVKNIIAIKGFVLQNGNLGAVVEGESDTGEKITEKLSLDAAYDIAPQTVFIAMKDFMTHMLIQEQGKS